MKPSIRYSIIAAALVFAIVAAVIGYQTLSRGYNQNNSLKKDNVTSPPDNLNETGAVSSNTAPDFTVLDQDGKTVKLSEFFGRPIILNFWATWCGPCKAEMPAFSKAYEQYGDDVVFLMVNLTDGFRDTVESAGKFVLDAGYKFPIYFDTQYSGARAYSVYSIPMTVVIDQNGNVADAHIGALTYSALENYIKTLLK